MLRRGRHDVEIKLSLIIFICLAIINYKLTSESAFECVASSIASVDCRFTAYFRHTEDVTYGNHINLICEQFCFRNCDFFCIEHS